MRNTGHIHTNQDLLDIHNISNGKNSCSEAIFLKEAQDMNIKINTMQRISDIKKGKK